MEAAAEGTGQGFFQTMTGDLFAYPVELSECRFKSETLCGEELLVSVWEGKERPR